ncbi:hypothetical protein F5Y02DRAFT_403154 [Annulohypoxylon stygium]|nr:hypothetical protein F5Y02DRAFT_403154 [Annulohypoxylon stygium]
MVNKPDSRPIIAAVVCWGLIVSLWVGMRVWARLIRKMSPLLPEDILCYLALVWCFNPRTLRV